MRIVSCFVAITAAAAGARAQRMSSPLASTTVLNNPSCNLPGPNSSSLVCAGMGSVATADDCASLCLITDSCTAYTWHDGNIPAPWTNACIFRTDGAWEPEPGAPDHTSGRKIPAVTWPIQNGYDRLPVMWFGANTSGLDSPDTLSVIARHAIGGYGWQQGTEGPGPAMQLGSGEVNLAEAATHLQDYLAAPNNSSSNNSNGTLVFVYRQIQVALRLFATALAASSDPATQSFWLRDVQNASNVCSLGMPWGTSDLMWNFSAPGATEYYLSHTIAEAAAEAAVVQAVFFDEVDVSYCGFWNSPQGGCSAQPAAVQAALQAANNDMLGQLVAQLNTASIIPLLSMDNRMAASNANTTLPMPCAVAEDATVAAIAAHNGTWARFYENWPSSYFTPDSPQLHAAMIANVIEEGKHGVPSLMHALGGTCPDNRTITRPGRVGGELEYSLAAFLIAQNPQSVYSISNNWFDENFCWHPEFSLGYGTPLGPAVRTSSTAFYRNFTQCNVEFDAENQYGAIYLL